jgi:hypothetical protein
VCHKIDVYQGTFFFIFKFKNILFRSCQCFHLENCTGPLTDVVANVLKRGSCCDFNKDSCGNLHVQQKLDCFHILEINLKFQSNIVF